VSQDVFISYSRVDLTFVEALNEFLEKVGLSTWFDKKSLLPGQKWETIIEDEIPISRVFLTCLSKAALDKRGHFHVEQNLAAQAALRIPPGELFIIPVLLGDCEIPRSFRQYQTVNLVEPGAIEMLLVSFSAALNRAVVASPESTSFLRDKLMAHLGTEGASNQDFVERFMQTDDISPQDSIGLIQRIANSSDTNRLTILLKLRALDFISYAEQTALDIAIENVKYGRRTENLNEAVTLPEKARIAQMSVYGSSIGTLQLQVNKYARYVARKNSEAYTIAEAKIRELLALGLDNLERE
jgi:hypothetical protein